MLCEYFGDFWRSCGQERVKVEALMTNEECQHYTEALTWLEFKHNEIADMMFAAYQMSAQVRCT